MKHPSQRHHRHQGGEWITAIATLVVLAGIYNSTENFDSYSALLAQPPWGSEKKITVAAPYWNETLSYGFRSVEGDSYSSSGSTVSDQVTVAPPETRVSEDGTVKVTFYPDTPIEEIETKHPENTPRAYSRLPNGIAVIEWDLSSPSATTILATLHAR